MSSHLGRNATTQNGAPCERRGWGKQRLAGVKEGEELTHSGGAVALRVAGLCLHEEQGAHSDADPASLSDRL